jgi:hypothetical protein
MRIDFNRICKLAGVDARSSNSGLMREGKDHDASAHEMAAMYENESDANESDRSEGDDPKETDEGSYGMHEEETDEGSYGMHEEAEDDQDEMVDIDMKELMSEIRRAKRIMAINEQKKRNIARRKKNLQENHLKRIIQKEVENILSEIEDKDSSWVYGEKKPRYSRQGYTNQGRTLPGIGFSKKW